MPINICHLQRPLAGKNLIWISNSPVCLSNGNRYQDLTVDDLDQQMLSIDGKDKKNCADESKILANATIKSSIDILYQILSSQGSQCLQNQNAALVAGKDALAQLANALIVEPDGIASVSMERLLPSVIRLVDVSNRLNDEVEKTQVTSSVGKLFGALQLSRAPAASFINAMHSKTTRSMLLTALHVIKPSAADLRSSLSFMSIIEEGIVLKAANIPVIIGISDQSLANSTAVLYDASIKCHRLQMAHASGRLPNLRISVLDLLGTSIYQVGLDVISNVARS